MTLHRRHLLAALALPVSRVLGAQVSPASAGKRILLCGGNAVYDARLAGSGSTLQWENIRTWRPERSRGLPVSYALSPFATTDDCKPIDDGRAVLVTSSAGGVAIYNRDTLETTFYAMASNAHSASLLPGGYLVVAASTHEKGNALVLFHRQQPEKELFRTPLYSAHGVVWDSQRETLYALGMNAVEEYSFTWGNNAAVLRKVRETKLPSAGGHELSPASAPAEMFVSTSTQVLVFNKDLRSCEVHPALGAMHHVKSISVHAPTGQLAYIRAEEGVWWSFQLNFLNPQQQIESPGQRLYKARWA